MNTWQRFKNSYLFYNFKQDPVAIAKRWLDEAFAARTQANPHAVALATVDPDGRPSVRMVLCNEIDAERGAFTMYTNLESRKARAHGFGEAKPNGRGDVVEAELPGPEERCSSAECGRLYTGARERPRQVELPALVWREAALHLELPEGQHGLIPRLTPFLWHKLRAKVVRDGSVHVGSY